MRQQTSLKWTEQETAALQQMLADNTPRPEIYARLPSRPQTGIDRKIWYLQLTPERRAADLQRRYDDNRAGPTKVARVENVTLVPDEVLAERDVRQQAPRSLTAILLGDPPPGYSALDRKLGCT